MDASTLPVHKNDEAKRFELEVDGHLALIDFMQTSELMIYTHTEVPESLEGKGIGSRLAQVALDYARDNDLLVMPMCPFVAAYIQRHPEYKDLVYRGKPRVTV